MDCSELINKILDIELNMFISEGKGVRKGCEVLRTRVNLYLVIMYLLGTLLWSLTFVVSGMLTYRQIAQGLLSPLLLIVAGAFIAVSLAYFNYSTLPNLQSGRAKGVLSGFFYWEMLIVLMYGTVGPVCGLSFHQWSSGPLTVAGIFLGIAACFVFAYPFFLKALEALEREFAEKTFFSDVNAGISLVFKMGLPFSLMVISDIIVIITVSNILSGLGVQDIMQRLLYVAAILILFSFSTIYFSMRSLKNTLAPLVERLKEAEEGHADLAVRLPVVTSDELGRIPYLFNRLLQNLNTVFTKVKESTGNVAGTSQQLHASVRQVAEASAASAASVSEIASTMDQVAENSQQVSRAAHESNELACRGRESMGRMGAQVEDMAAAADQVRQAIEELDSNAGEITGILNMIAQIADQTNLLALNAAIEAARAGESGRGFAVVAEEVRRLAEQSNSSAGEIHRLITRNQQKARAALEAITAGGEKMREGLQVVGLVKGAFDEILEKVERVSGGIQQVAAAVQETSAGVQDIAAAAREQSAFAEEISAAGESLRGLAENLSKEVEKFKIAG